MKIQMKKIFVVSFLAITYAATAQYSMPANEDRPATHGMLIFGTNKFTLRICRYFIPRIITR